MEQLKKLQAMAYQLPPDGPNDQVSGVRSLTRTSIRCLMCRDVLLQVNEADGAEGEEE